MRLKSKSDGGMARSNSSFVLTNLLKTTTCEWKSGRIAHTMSEYARAESAAISKHRVASHYLIQAVGTFLNPEDQKRTESGRKAEEGILQEYATQREKVQEDHAREIAR